MPKRVFILCSEPPENPGGVEHFVRELGNGLEAKGYVVEVLHQGNCLPYRLRAPSGRLSRTIADAALSWYLGKQVQARWSDDICAVISNGAVGWYIPRPAASDVKLVHMYHGTYRAQAEAIRHSITRLGYLKMAYWDSMVLERFSGRSKLALCCSDQVRDEVARYFGQTAVTVWNPLDTIRFRPLDKQACRRKLELPEEATLGLYVGSCHPMKGFAFVRETMKQVADAHWVLALRGLVPDDLLGKPHVKIFRDVDSKQLPEIYAAADFALAPSLYEPFGYVVAEALACGLPTIASPGGASSLFLNQPPTDRLLIPREDAMSSLTDTVQMVIRDPEFFRRAVMEVARPKVLAAMAPENWLKHFCEVTGL